MTRRFLAFVGLHVLIVLTSCQAVDDASQPSADLEKRLARYEVRVGLTLLLRDIQQEAKRKDLSEEKVFAEVFSNFKSDQQQDFVYEYGAWGPRSDIEKTWMSKERGPNSLAYQNYEKLSQLLDEKLTPLDLSVEKVILAVANLDKDEELDLWAINFNREVFHLNAD